MDSDPFQFSNISRPDADRHVQTIPPEHKRITVDSRKWPLSKAHREDVWDRVAVEHPGDDELIKAATRASAPRPVDLRDASEGGAYTPGGVAALTRRAAGVAATPTA